MAYQACVRAKLVRHTHTRDNTIEGELEADGHRFTYESRGHIVKAVNRLYRSVNWKPSEGDEVLIDGDFVRGHAVIDHIEAWAPQDYSSLDRHTELVERLRASLPAFPELGKALRHHAHNDNGDEVRVIRWQNPTRGWIGRAELPAVVSAIIANDDIRFCARTQDGGRGLQLENTAILPLIAETLGIPMLDVSAPKPSRRERVLGTRKPNPMRNEPAKSKLSAGDPNKWRPGQPYRPIGMPEPQMPEGILDPDIPPFPDCPF